MGALGKQPGEGRSPVTLGRPMTLGLLVLGACLYYGWALVPPDAQPLVWNVSGALARLILLWCLVWPRRTTLMLWVAAWWTVEDLLVAGCSALYMVRPWKVAPGDAMCSALLQFDLGKIGAVFLAVLLVAWWRQNVDARG